MKKLAIAINKNTGCGTAYAFKFLRQAAQDHAARMKNAGNRREIVRVHYVTWLERVRAYKRLAYYGYSPLVHIHVS